MMDKQGQARLTQRVRRLYLPHDGLPLFCDACDVDAATGLCNGCLRSLREITNWSILSHEDRHAVWNHIIATRLIAARDAERAARQAPAQRRSVPPVELAPETKALPVPDALPPSGHEAQPVTGPEPVVAGVAPVESAQSAASDLAQGDATPVATVPAQTASAEAEEPAETAAMQVAVTQQAPAEETADASGLAEDIGEDMTPAMTADAAETSAPGTVPVDVAAARAEQVRAEMLRVVQAALARTRRESAQAPSDPAEIKLKPLV